MCPCSFVDIFVFVFCFAFFSSIRVSGMCDNRNNVLKVVGNMPLDGWHFFFFFCISHFGLLSQISLLRTSLNCEALKLSEGFYIHLRIYLIN